VNYIRDEKGIKQLGKRIKKLRLEQKVTQTQLAFEAGITREQLGRIENGKINTSVSNVFALARALNIDLKDIFDFKI
jgi:transcriptional regulator with XRE-family HTH domain